MSQKRMFSLEIIDTDAFLTMPSSAQSLYFHLGMRADDDGFVSSPKKIMSICNASEDDMKILIGKRYVLTFQSGILVLKHWKIHNYIQKDRYRETKYLEEKSQIRLKENGSYTECIQDVSKMETQIRLDKVRLDKINNIYSDEKKEKKLEIDESMVEKLKQKGFPEELVNLEIKKFMSYWTEPNQRGKQRWEGQKFFDVSRRLATWFGNIADRYSKNQTKHINLDNLA